MELETKNLMVVGVWSFVIIWLVGTFVVQADALIALMLFFVAIVISLVTIALPAEKKSEKQVVPV